MSIVRYKIQLIVFFVCFFAGMELHAQQQSSDLDGDKKHLEEQIQLTNKLIKTVEGNQQAGLQELALIKSKINSRKQKLSTINKRIDDLNADLERKRETIDMLQDELDDLRRSYAELLNQYYTIRNKSNWLMYIMASENITQAYRRMQYFREIMAIMRARADKITEASNRLNNEIADMARKQQDLLDNKGDKDLEMQKLKDDESQSQTVLAGLRKEKDALNKQLRKDKEAYDMLDKEVMKHISEVSIPATPELLSLTNDFESSKGRLPWPTREGIIVTHFGNKQKHPDHDDVVFNSNGIDIQTALNADVYAVFGGEVTLITTMMGEKCVIVRHGAYYSLYYRLGDVVVKKGDEVKARQKLGVVSLSDKGSVLHFEISKTVDKKGTERYNPEQWLIR